MSETRMKRCGHCGSIGPLDEFHIDESKRTGLSSWCRQCKHSYDLARKSPNHQAYASMKRRDAKKGAKTSDHGSQSYWKQREWTWKHNGITLKDGSPFLSADYHRLSDLQGGVCALCGRHPPMWSATLDVDHDRKTGIVRGLLCGECNHRAVGKFEQWGRFGSRPEVNDLIRSYLENPPASRLSEPPKETPELLPETPVYSVITSPPKSYISWTPLFAHEATL